MRELTVRELQVATLLGSGASQADTARALGLSRQRVSQLAAAVARKAARAAAAQEAAA